MREVGGGHDRSWGSFWPLGGILASVWGSTAVWPTHKQPLAGGSFVLAKGLTRCLFGKQQWKSSCLRISYVIMICTRSALDLNLPF